MQLLNKINEWRLKRMIRKLVRQFGQDGLRAKLLAAGWTQKELENGVYELRHAATDSTLTFWQKEPPHA